MLSLWGAVVLIVFLVIAGGTVTAIGGSGHGADASRSPGSDVSTGLSNPTDLDRTNEGGPSLPDSGRICLEWLWSLGGILGWVGLTAAVLGTVYWRYNVSTMLLASTAIVPVLFATYFFLANCGDPEGGVPEPGSAHIAGHLVETIALAPELVVLGTVGVAGVTAATAQRRR